MNVLTTKIRPPVRRTGIIARSRLDAALERARGTAFTLIQAPAGYGKTVLMTQWHDLLKQEGSAAGWLTIGRYDRRSCALFSNLAAMLSTIDRNLGDSLTQLFAMDGLATVKVAIEAILASLAAYRRPVFLLLDDISQLDQKCTGILASLIEGLPENTHIIATARQVPELNLARNRGRMALVEIGLEELRFTHAEAAQYFAESGEDDLSPAQVAALFTRTEGWVTGLALARSGLQRAADRSGFIESFSGAKRSVRDFFVSDVLADLSPELQEFLLQTCILDRLSAELCDAVTLGHTGRQMIDRMEEAGLFLLQLDDERQWYRYHSMFSDVLRRRLADERPAASGIAHRRASQWYMEQGLPIEAIEHAVRARDPIMLASLLDGLAEPFMIDGRSCLIDRYAATLPEETLAGFPRLMMVVAWLRTHALRLDDARLLLRRIAGAIETLKDASLPRGTVDELELMHRHQVLMLAGAHDDIAKVERQARELASLVADTKPYMACTVSTLQILAQREQFSFGAVEACAAQARVGAKRSRYRLGTITLNVVLAPTLFAMGRIDPAIALLEEALREGARYAGPRSGLAALPALALAEILYERNDVARAAELARDHLPVARDFSFVDQLISGYVTHAQIAAEATDLTCAMTVLDEAMEIALECGVERFRTTVTAARIALLLRAGHSEEALAIGRRERLLVPAAEMMPPARAQTRDEIRATAWVRLAQIQDRGFEALTVAKRWSAFCAHRGAVRCAVRWHLLTASIQVGLSDGRAAQRALREALKVAAPGRFIRSFLNEGPVVQRLLEEQYGTRLMENSAPELFASDLLAAFGGSGSIQVAEAEPEDLGLSGRLSGREIEILSLVSNGLRNREIGDRLGLTEGSVKWYMQQVYDKVGSRRRSQAVDRARHFGLIA